MDDLSVRRGFRTAITITVVAMLCVSPGAAITSTGLSPVTFGDVSDSQFVDASDSVSVWQKAAFPLRVNAASSSGTVVENQRMTVLAEEQSAEIRLNKQQLAVFNPDDEIEMSFKSRSPVSTQAFEDAEVQLLVAKAGPNSSALLSGSNLSTNGLLDTLTNAEQSGNVAFELQDLGRLQDGTTSASYDVSESGAARGPGQYAFFIVQTTEGDGFTVNDGSLAVDGKARVLGADIAVVQAAEASASVMTEDPAPGDEVTFDVDSTFTHSNVSHAIMLYNESQYANSWTRFTVSGPMNEKLSADQVSVTSTIIGVNGTRNVTGTTRIGGVTIGDGVVQGETRVGSVADWLADQPSGASTDAETPGQTTGSWLDASVTAVSSTDGTATISVQSEESWADGTYRYVYLAQANGQNNLSTTTGTIELGADENREDESDGGSGDGGDDNGNDGSNGRSGGGGGGGGAGAPPANPGPAEPNRGDISDGRADVKVGTGITELRVGFRAGGTGGSVVAQELNARPDTVPAIPNARELRFVDITVPEDRTEDEATLQFDVDTAMLDGVSPDQLVVYHYHDGEWSALETTVVSSEETVVTLEATTPGFSLFAVGVADESSDSVEDGSGDGADSGDADSGDDGESAPDTENEPADAETPEGGVEGEGPAQEEGGFDIILIGAIALFAVLAGFYVYRGAE
ncbi:PGF-pre-PGF domain-containing protein [Halogeometricum sp. S1BR25-6]|uniref:PGF-pre-PGF domain-containing protein n=1 Tax=Halogeometricum salsisoli TaxID=2950536 RepID=A0ABU2GIM5_9EURY|nr:PGF-pre-PGF domain-containing protein [Halogeometricum sp. S1BR25-6]MDS0300139.1 PGF-pre-PGF domain-containing protein [Halogeometricum sp. S1BR25-6]